MKIRIRCVITWFTEVTWEKREKGTDCEHLLSCRVGGGCIQNTACGKKGDDMGRGLFSFRSMELGSLQVRSTGERF
jgi:hypothetical protein